MKPGGETSAGEESDGWLKVGLFAYFLFSRLSRLRAYPLDFEEYFIDKNNPRHAIGFSRLC